MEIRYDANAEDIGSIIRKARKENGLTQKQLAELCNCAVGTIQQYETGKRKPQFEHFIKICTILCLSFSFPSNTGLDVTKTVLELAANPNFQKLELQEIFTDILNISNAHQLGILTTILELYFGLNEDGAKELLKRAQELHRLTEYTTKKG